MKRIFTLLTLILIIFKANAQHDFKSFLNARILLHLYDEYYNGQIVDMRPYEKYHDVNLGFNNYKKSILFLRYYYQQKDFDKVRAELNKAIGQGLFLDNIPKEIRNDKNVWNQEQYLESRGRYLAGMDADLLNQILTIQRKDQWFRAMDSLSPGQRDSAIMTDKEDADRLIALTETYGWLGEKRFDKYNCKDSCGYDLRAIISHFGRKKIIYFRDIAMKEAEAGKISWDEVVILEHGILWRYPRVVKKNLELYPLELMDLKRNGEVNWKHSWFELYTLGHVMLGGMQHAKIELYPTSRMLQQYPRQTAAVLNAIRDYLVNNGAKKENISITQKCCYPEGDWKDCFLGYRITYRTGGILNWYRPYGLVML